MNLEPLIQYAELDRNMASPLHSSLEAVQTELLHRNPQAGQRWTGTEALTVKPLKKLLKKVDKLVQRDQKPLKPQKVVRGRRVPPKPHRLRLDYDELTVVRLYYARLLATDPDNYYLVGVLGRLHQPSLNLETHIDLDPATVPTIQIIPLS
jgi:hypothetical protein